MRTLHRKAALSAALACSALLLSACGGGGGGSGDSGFVAGSDVPAAATTSVASLIEFMQQLIAGTDETSAPIAVGDAQLATSETDEPVARP